MADFAEGKKGAEPPRELEYGLNFRSFGKLPVDGGQLEQPAGLLKRMRVALNVYDAVTAYRNRPTKAGGTGKWIENHRAYWDIIQSVEALRAKNE